MRHGRNHFLINGHLFLDGALHADQSNPELVLQQLTDGTDASVAKMIDVVDLANVLAKFQQVRNDGVEIRRFENALLEWRCKVKLDVELQATDFREVVLPRVEKH